MDSISLAVQRKTQEFGELHITLTLGDCIAGYCVQRNSHVQNTSVLISRIETAARLKSLKDTTPRSLPFLHETDDDNADALWRKLLIFSNQPFDDRKEVNICAVREVCRLI